MSLHEDGQCPCQRAENTLKSCRDGLKNSREYLQLALDTSNLTENSITDEWVQKGKELCEIVLESLPQISQDIKDQNLKERFPQLESFVQEVEDQVDELKEEVEELLIHITNMK